MKREPRPPRNYLGRGERQRLFWLWMPPACLALLVAGWLERTYLRREAEPGFEQVDTVVRFAPEPVPDAVVIEPDPPEAVGDVAGDLAVPARMLSTVRDDTVFREGDREAWFALLQSLRSADPQQLRASKATRVSFAELFSQPKAFRGRLVRFTGLVKRLQYVEAPRNDANIDGYWQAWVRPDVGPPTPIVVYFLEVPAGFPTGMRIEQRAEVVGYFFKRWLYQATDAARTAPLVVARMPYAIDDSKESSPMNWVGTFAMATMVGVVGISALAAWVANRGGRRRPERPAGDLSEQLAGIVPESTEESLRRLAAEELPPPTADASRPAREANP